MFKALLNGILNTLASIISILLTPINNLLSTLFPNMSGLITYFNNFVNNYLSNNLSWFFSLLPPGFKYCLTTWFTFVIAYYGILFTYRSIIKIWNIIQKVKVW